MSLLRQARIEAHLTIEEAAGRARISIDYLRRVERSGQCSLPCAKRLGRLYGAPIDLFILQIGQATTAEHAGKEKKANSTQVQPSQLSLLQMTTKQSNQPGQADGARLNRNDSKIATLDHVPGPGGVKVPAAKRLAARLAAEDRSAPAGRGRDLAER